MTRRLSYANVMSTLGVFLALGGVGYAAGVLPANSVGTTQLKNGAVTGAKVRPESLLAKSFKAGQLPRGQVGPQGVPGPPGPQGPQGPQGVPGAKYIELTGAEVDPSAPSEIKAFIPTSSSSPNCLVTLAESVASAASGTTVYCGTRNYNGVNGIYIHVFLPAPAVPDVLVAVTVYQESAQGYGPPVLFPGP